MSVGVSVCFIINMNQGYFNFSVFISRMYLLNVSLTQTQFWSTVNFNRLFWPVWTMAPELQSKGTCRHSWNPPGDSPVSLLSLGNLAELKDCVCPMGGVVGKAGSLSVGNSPWQSTALEWSPVEVLCHLTGNSLTSQVPTAGSRHQ